MKTAIIVSAYRRYEYVNEAIKSVISQTKKPNEIIIGIDNPKVLKIPKTNIKIKVIERDYPEYGKAIAECLDEVGKDIDIVMFLEDDDLFRKDKIEKIVKYFKEFKDIVAIHNLQHIINKEGKKVNSTIYEKEQPNKNLIINLDNLLKIYNRYPLIWHNLSSFSIKKEILEKYKKHIKKVLFAIDVFVFFCSISEGNLLHLKEKLTYFRLGGSSSTSSISNFLTFRNEVTRRICTEVKNLNSFRTFLEIFNDSRIKKIIKKRILEIEIYLYLFSEFLKECNVDFPTFFYSSLLRGFIENAFDRNLNIFEFFKYLSPLFLSKILGREIREVYLKYRYYLNR
jgi:hypothetical protein